MRKSSNNNFLTNEDGWVTPFSLMFIAGMFTMLGITVEYANIGFAKAKMQSATDAVALAAMQAMPDEEIALDYGLDVAAMYFGNEDSAAIGQSDIEFGVWDSSSDSFYASAVGVNSIRVVATMSSSRGNALSTIVSSLSGFGDYDIRTESVAYTSYNGADSGVSCSSGGFFAEKKVKFDKGSVHSGNICIYGEEKVEMNKDNEFSEDVVIGIGEGGKLKGAEKSDLDPDSVFENSLTLDLANMAGDIISDMKAGELDDVGDFGTYTLREISTFSQGDILIPYSFYVIDGMADFSQLSVIEDVAVYAKSQIHVGSDVSVDNVLFATDNMIKFGKNVTFGNADYCFYQRYTTYLFADENIEFGADNVLRAIQMASEKSIKINDHADTISDVHAEALKNIEYRNYAEVSACDDPLISDFGEQPDKDDVWDCVGILTAIEDAEEDEEDDDSHHDDDDDDDDDSSDWQAIYDENCSTATTSAYGLVL